MDELAKSSPISVFGRDRPEIETTAQLPRAQYPETSGAGDARHLLFAGKMLKAADAAQDPHSPVQIRACRARSRDLHYRRDGPTVPTATPPTRRCSTSRRLVIDKGLRRPPQMDAGNLPQAFFERDDIVLRLRPAISRSPSLRRGRRRYTIETVGASCGSDHWMECSDRGW